MIQRTRYRAASSERARLRGYASLSRQDGVMRHCTISTSPIRLLSNRDMRILPMFRVMRIAECVVCAKREMLHHTSCAGVHHLDTVTLSQSEKVEEQTLSLS